MRCQEYHAEDYGQQDAVDSAGGDQHGGCFPSGPANGQCRQNAEQGEADDPPGASAGIGAVLSPQRKQGVGRIPLLALRANIQRIPSLALRANIEKRDRCIGAADDGGDGGGPEAVIFGKREDLLREARTRMAENPGKYVPKIYGETDGGGTQCLYLSHVDFEKVGLPALGEVSTPTLQRTIQHGIYKGFAAPVALYGLLGLVMLRNRRKEGSAS